MNSKRSKRFRELFMALPVEVRRQAYETYRLFKHDPHHPSLHFKRVGQNQPIYSIRIGIAYRALGRCESDDVIVWFWIGTHADYDNILGQR